MAQEYSFTQQERNNLFAPSKVYSSFGRDTLNDFIVLHVYTPDSVSDENATLLGTKILSLGEVEFNNFYFIITCPNLSISICEYRSFSTS